MADDLKNLQRIATAQGWTVERQRSGHLRWYPPDRGPFVVSQHTASDYRSYRNLLGQLRRAGLRLPRKDGRPA